MLQGIRIILQSVLAIQEVTLWESSCQS